ncbi:TPA: homoserine O-succinyltransferase, partial [Pseudomonas aeruginosa]|nr:homoserine O-succinyltransferase [Pseudomonas aeruginosa]
WMLMPVEPLLNMMSDKDHDTRITAERQLLSILAAAPGKEVGHE